jgi:hypothetical protein
VTQPTDDKPSDSERLLQIATWLKWIRDDQALRRSVLNDQELQAAIVDLERIASDLRGR